MSRINETSIELVKTISKTGKSKYLQLMVNGMPMMATFNNSKLEGAYLDDNDAPEKSKVYCDIVVHKTKENVLYTRIEMFIRYGKNGLPISVFTTDKSFGSLVNTYLRSVFSKDVQECISEYEKQNNQ